MASPADTLAQSLASSGTTVAFGLPGGGPNLDVVGAFASAGIEFVLAHTETAACIMAATWGYLTDQVTATVVTRGPGVASAVNGAAQATLDRYPLLLVCDTVPSSSRDRVPHQRIDQQALLAPVTKAGAVLCATSTPEDVASYIDTAQAWPAGAVHLDYDATSATLERPIDGTAPIEPSSEPELTAAVAQISTAQHPVVILGAAAVASAEALRAPLVSFGAPVLTTYQAIGIVDTNNPICGGLFTNGASERPLLDRADLIITIGLDLVEPIPAEWDYQAPVIAISATPTTDPYLPIEIEIIAAHTELAAVTTQLLASDHASTHDWEPGAGQAHAGWVRNQLISEPTTNAFRPVDLVDSVSSAAPSGATVTVDAGAHFLAIMPLWPVAHARQLLISNGLATMGFAVPAAIGAAIARPGEPVIALTGDGGLGMCLAELETIARRNLPITVVVFNDAALSLIEIKQTADHGGRDAVRYAPTDFAATAASMGMAGVIAVTPAEVSTALRDRKPMSPLLIDARIDPSSYPHLMQVTRSPRDTSS